MEISLFLPSPTVTAEAGSTGVSADQRSSADGRKSGVQTQSAVLSVQAPDGASLEQRPASDGSGRGRIVDITV